MYSLQSIGVKAASLVIGRANLAIQFFYRPATIEGFDLVKCAFQWIFNYGNRNQMG